MFQQVFHHTQQRHHIVPTSQSSPCQLPPAGDMPPCRRGPLRQPEPLHACMAMQCPHCPSTSMVSSCFKLLFIGEDGKFAGRRLLPHISQLSVPSLQFHTSPRIGIRHRVTMVQYLRCVRLRNNPNFRRRLAPPGLAPCTDNDFRVSFSPNIRVQKINELEEKSCMDMSPEQAVGAMDPRGWDKDQ